MGSTLKKAALFATPQGRLKLLLHLPNLIKFYWRLFTDKRVSLLAKVVLVAGLVYFVVPTDLIPDFPLVGLGQLDDAVVLILALRGFVALAPRRVVEEHVRLIDEGG